MHSYTYNIDDSIYKERNKTDYEREYHNATKSVLENQQPLFKNSKFDNSVFNKLFVQNNKHSIESAPQGEIEELVSTNANYTDIETGNTHNITSIGHAAYSIYDEHNENPIFTKEDIKKAKKQVIPPISKLNNSEINSLISKRNAEKLEFNTEPMKKTSSYELINNPVNNPINNPTNNNDLMTLTNQLILEQTKNLNLQTKELNYINQINDLKKENHKLKKINTKLLEELQNQLETQVKKSDKKHLKKPK
jgi:hypothetical protein